MSSFLYKTYTRELRKSIAQSMRNVASEPAYEKSFEVFSPVWALLYSLRDSANVPNPTKAMLLSYFREADDLKSFIKVSRDYRIEREYGGELQLAHQATLFTSYFDELISDSLLFVNSFHLSNYRGCVIALRCVLEDLYRHLYYKDNRESFLKVHELGTSEHELNLSPASFRQYLAKATYLAPLDSLNWNFNVAGKNHAGLQKLNAALYGKTSAYVHGSSPLTHNAFSSSEDLAFSASEAQNVIALAEQMCKLIVAFLCCAHLDQYMRMNESMKRIVLKVFSNAERQDFRVALRT